jgi:hypothetical protein
LYIYSNKLAADKVGIAVPIFHNEASPKGHFHSSNIINNATQRDMLTEMRRDSAEKKELLLAILSMQSERQQVVALQRQGEHVAEEFMAAGQQVS